jgi:uncharacterized spore protein YtfJ
MQDVEKLLRTAIEEIERILSTKSVVGEPITIEDNSIIPLVSIGFGFGAGIGMGKIPESNKGEGAGGGTVGGGGIKPIGIIVIGKDGVRLETIKGGTLSLLGKVSDNISKIIQQKMKKETPQE